MLAFDIETTGLCPHRDKITLVCTEDFKTGKRTAYEFARVAAEKPGDTNAIDQLFKTLQQQFDAATTLCAFNGIRFDIPFLANKLKLTEVQKRTWVDKTSDLLEISRLVWKQTFSLDSLCKTNDIQTKMASGKQAVIWAKEKKFDKLLEYCTDDVRILCDLYRKRHLKHPVSQKAWDIGQHVSAELYQPAAPAADDERMEDVGAANSTASATAESDPGLQPQTVFWADQDAQYYETALQDTRRDYAALSHYHMHQPCVVLSPRNVLQLAFSYFKLEQRKAKSVQWSLSETVAAMLDSGRYEMSDKLAVHGLQPWMSRVFEVNAVEFIASGGSDHVGSRVRMRVKGFDLERQK